jgi:hypothetical protein
MFGFQILKTKKKKKNIGFHPSNTYIIFNIWYNRNNKLHHIGLAKFITNYSKYPATPKKSKILVQMNNIVKKYSRQQKSLLDLLSTRLDCFQGNQTKSNAPDWENHSVCLISITRHFQYLRFIYKKKSLVTKFF